MMLLHMMLASIMALLAGTTHALPALTPCASATNGASDRWGICAGGSPLSLRGSNYIRLGGSTVPGCTGYHTTFDAGVYNRSRYIAAFKSMQSQKSTWITCSWDLEQFEGLSITKLPRSSE